MVPQGQWRIGRRVDKSSRVSWSEIERLSRERRGAPAWGPGRGDVRKTARPQDRAGRRAGRRGPAGRGSWSVLRSCSTWGPCSAGALGVPPSSLLERTIAELFTPYYDLVDLGYSYRYYAEPPPTPVVTATLGFGEAGPRRRCACRVARWRALGCVISGSWPWRMRFSWMCRRPKQRTGDSSKSRLARAYARHLCLTRPDCRMRDAPSPASSDSRAGAGARGDPVARRAAVRPVRRVAVHHARVDRRLPVRRLLNDVASLPGRSLAVPRSQGLERVFLLRGRPDCRWVDPRSRWACWRSGACWSSGWTCTTISARRGWAEPGAIRTLERPLAWSFWFLVPDGWLRPVWCLCLAVLALYTLGLFSRVTAVLGWVIVVSTVRRVPIALYGFDQVLSTLVLYLAVTGASGQAVSLDRFWRRWRQARAAAAPGRSSGPAARAGASRPTSRASPGHGLGQPGLATDPASPGRHLWHGRPGETSGPVVVERHRALEDDGDRRVRGARFHGAGGVAVAHQFADARQPGARACSIRC